MSKYDSIIRHHTPLQLSPWKSSNLCPPATNYVSDIYVKILLVAQYCSAPQELTLAELSLILMNRVSMKVIHHWQISLSTVFQLALTTLIKACLAFRHIQISFNISAPNEQASCLIRSHRYLCSLPFSSVIRGALCICCIIFLKALIGAHSLVFSCEDLVCCCANLYNVLGGSWSPAARAWGLFSCSVLSL